MKTVYLDNNATTKVAPEVIEAMLPFFGEQYGNASSMHTFGGRVARHIDRAREQVAALIGADPSEIVFTSCGTESDNMAIHGAVAALRKKRRVVVTSRVEHPAVRATCRHLAAEKEIDLREIGVSSEGLLDMDHYREALDQNTALVSLMWANNETGVIFPIAEAAELAKARGAIFHTDAVQAVGKVPIDVRKVPVDMLALSGHKLHAPKGVGATYIRKGTRIDPYLTGGHQEGGKRAGTENVPYIVGLGAAAELAMRNFGRECGRVKALRDRLEAEILAACPDVYRNGAREPRIPNTANVSFEYIEGESILSLLDEFGICASSGSACTSGSLEPSHVMRAMGVPFTRAHGSIRFSLSRYTTDAEVDFVIARMPGIVGRLRKLSPFVRE